MGCSPIHGNAQEYTRGVGVPEATPAPQAMTTRAASGGADSFRRTSFTRARPCPDRNRISLEFLAVVMSNGTSAETGSRVSSHQIGFLLSALPAMSP
jgi:hypothetical protein